ncbi:MAG: deoxyribodipyrimidine photolyase [Betaproteobacteria bacterium HGW-Betaproteobacteria-17]|jgi:diguanylate cyclase (GGDEF)-like protein|nr:MAG: deoxyribodipyrimidine photolyase [Deltaproteobacteria bacterium HGW-Deltaproteobacteria-14]PKO73262.1 MAG: deoxyribodipyrimidine photolyase [Betaproteobacteria bacterium HGW-Betaproteobacteria-17]
MHTDRQQLIRSLFDEYIEMYAARDDRVTTRFSENFSGYTGGGDFLVREREAWVDVTRQDFAQVTDRIRIEMLDLALQDLSEDVVLVTAFFHIHLPLPDQILSRETARLVLAFRREGDDWRIVHSGISIPYPLVRAGEVYPLRGLQERNRELEGLIEVRTRALEEARAQLEALSYTDALTGVANRRSFDRTLAQEWSRGQRAGTPLAVIILDVDKFKHFNDHYGHLAGDEALRALASALSGAVRRAGEVVARFGGEEFVLLLPDTNVRDAVTVAERAQQAIRARALPHAGVEPGIVSVSLGVASVVPVRELPPESLLRLADAALYRAKALGRDRLELASD